MRVLLMAAIGAGFAFSCEGGEAVTVEELRAHDTPGSIFTTIADGTLIDGDVYQLKEEVFLEAGRGLNAPDYVEGLAEGDYFFQVTDASGETLLSSDHISCRRVHVNAAGVIDRVYAGTNWVLEEGTWVEQECLHSSVADPNLVDLGGLSVQLMPFETSAEDDGLYKIWMTEVADYAGNAAAIPSDDDFALGADLVGFHGFLPDFAKSHSFTAHTQEPEPQYLKLLKFHDRNMNGSVDPGEEMITGWQMVVRDPSGTTNYYYTPASVMASTGEWHVTENLVPHTLQTVSMLDGVIQSQYPTADPLVQVTFSGGSGETHWVKYGNVGLGRIKACKYYDENGDGHADYDDPPIPGWQFELTGTTILGDPVGPILAVAGVKGCATFRDLLPGDYTVTELIPGPGWYPTGPTSTHHTIESMVWGDIVTGGSHTAIFTNQCFDGADFGTKGYWHNMNGLAEMTDADIAYVNGLLPYSSPSSYFEDGDEPFDGMFTDGTPVDGLPGMGALIAPDGSPRAEVSAFLVDSNAGGDPREQLAQQLLAFIFNARNRLPSLAILLELPDGSFLSAEDIILSSIDIWDTGSAQMQRRRAWMLAWFNENGVDGNGASCRFPDGPR